MCVKNRILEYIEHKNIPIKHFEEKCKLSNGYISSMRKGFGTEKLENVLKSFPDLNREWLLYGEGEMLKSDNSVQFYNPDVAPTNRRLIPLYDDASTIGGSNEVVSDSNSGNVAEWIDPGDWFRNATHAIRHYEDSMVEYPSGCILAMKEVLERELVVWGRDYVIETDEYRITKRVQRGDTPDSIKAYSSNLETYPDGRLIHEPIDIQWRNVRKIFLVLGYVVKKGSGTIVISNQK